MPRDWNQLAASTDGMYQVQDFRRAMYSIVIQQCLYLRQREHAVAYRLIAAHRAEFSEALALMGLRLGFSPRYEFCYVAQDEGAQSQLDLHDTLFLLVLRSIYHTRAGMGDLNENGDAIVDIAQYEESYKALCQRDPDLRNDVLRAQLKMANRHGVARAVDAPDGDPQPFVIAILPGIAEVLSEHSLNRFGAELKARLALLNSSNSAAVVDQP